MKELDEKVAIIKESLKELTGDHKKALIINQFLYWSERTINTKKLVQEVNENANEMEEGDYTREYGWIRKKAKKLSDELMVNYCPQTIRSHIKGLIEKGYLKSQETDQHAYDHTKEYRVETVKLREDLAKAGYSIDEHFYLNKLDNTKFNENATNDQEKPQQDSTSNNKVGNKSDSASANQNEAGNSIDNEGSPDTKGSSLESMKDNTSESTKREKKEGARESARDISCYYHDEDSNEYKLTEHLHSRIRNHTDGHNPNFSTDVDDEHIQDWCNHIHDLLNPDRSKNTSYAPKEVRKVINWIFDEKEWDWPRLIRSAEDLRDNMDELYQQMKSDGDWADRDAHGEKESLADKIRAGKVG